MKKYTIFYTRQASADLFGIVNYIEKNLYAPLAAENFYYGIRKAIEELEESADIYKVSEQLSILKYGLTTRRINYKDFAIIYTIEDAKVVIHRIIHGSLIT